MMISCRWKSVLFPLTLCGALLVVAAGYRAGVAQPESPSLPGARPVIDAAAFPSLQAALDVLPAAGGLVRLPPGEFVIREPLVIRRSDVCLEGAGTATNIRNENEDGQPAIVLAHPEHTRDGNNRGKELWRIRLANFRVTGNESSGHGIAAYNINEIFLDGVTVSYHGQDGIRLDHCYEDPRISDCLITYNRAVGVNLLGCHDIVVAANQFEENRDALHCIAGFNLCMTGNCLDDHLGSGVTIEDTYGSVLSGNMIEECAGAAVILDKDCYGITISANVIAHNGAGIDLRDAHGCAVSANTLTLMKSDAVRVGPESGRIAIVGNAFSSSYIGQGVDKRAEDDRTAAGLKLEQSSSVLVDGNVFSSVGPPAIQSTPASQEASVIINNLLIGSEPGVLSESVQDGTIQRNYHDGTSGEDPPR